MATPDMIDGFMPSPRLPLPTRERTHRPRRRLRGIIGLIVGTAVSLGVAIESASRAADPTHHKIVQRHNTDVAAPFNHTGTTYYLSTTGNDSADGLTPSTAWLTFSKAQTAASNGDKIVVANGYYCVTAPDPISSSKRLWFDAETRYGAVMTHGRFCSLWTADTGNTYKTAIGVGKNVQTVLRNWDDPDFIASSLAVGNIRKCAMIATTSLANCRSTSNSFYYNSGTGDLYVNFAGANPSSDIGIITYPTMWVQGGLTSHARLLGDNMEFSGFRIENAWDRGSIDPNDYIYGVRVEGRGCVLRWCIFEHIAWHATGASSVANDVSGSVIEDCTFIGQGPVSGGSHCVTYSEGTADLVNVQVRRCTFHNFLPLKVDGAPIDKKADGSALGFVQIAAIEHHRSYSDPTKKMHGVIHSNCTAYGYQSPWSFNGGGDSDATYAPTAGTSAELFAANYPVQFKDCSVYGGYVGFTANVPHNVSYLRCIMIFDQLLAGAELFRFAFVVGGAPAQNRVCMESCHIVANNYASSGYRYHFQIQNTTGAETRLCLLNTNVLDVTTLGAIAFGHFFWAGVESVGIVRSHGCVLAGLTPGHAGQLHQGDAGLTTAIFDFVGNWYYGIYPTAYSAEFARRNAAGWQGIDPLTRAVYDVQPSFVAVASSAAFTIGAGLGSVKYNNAIHTANGINRSRPYGKRYGSWQDGGGGNTVGVITDLLLGV